MRKSRDNRSWMSKRKTNKLTMKRILPSNNPSQLTSLIQLMLLYYKYWRYFRMQGSHLQLRWFASTATNKLEIKRATYVLWLRSKSLKKSWKTKRKKGLIMKPYSLLSQTMTTLKNKQKTMPKPLSQWGYQRLKHRLQMKIKSLE